MQKKLYSYSCIKTSVCSDTIHHQHEVIAMQCLKSLSEDKSMKVTSLTDRSTVTK